MNIEGGEISGTAGIGMKSGTLNIAGGHIQATGTYRENITSNGSGINNDGSAVLIDSNIGYAGSMNINISGDAVIESADGSAVREVGDESGATNLVSVEVTCRS